MDLHPDLAILVRDIEAVVERTHKLGEGLDDAALKWQPEPGRWSIAECIAHLNTVNGLDLMPLARVIDEAQQKGMFSPGPYRYGWLSRWFLRNLDEQGARKFKAPAIYLPPQKGDSRKLFEEFFEQHKRLDQLVRRANGLDLTRVKAPTPVTKLLKFPLGMRFQLLVAHDRRHLRQAEDVKAAIAEKAATRR